MGIFSFLGKGKNKGSGGKSSGSTASGNKKTGKRGPWAFVFICKGPDPSGMRSMFHGFGMTDRGVYDAMKSFGFTGSPDNVVMFGPDWNSTTYSSWKPQGEGEADDLVRKIKEALKKKGFAYNGEAIKTARYDPSTTYGQMGIFMTYIFID